MRLSRRPGILNGFPCPAGSGLLGSVPVKERHDNRVKFHHDGCVVYGCGPSTLVFVATPARFQPDQGNHVLDLLDRDRRVEEVRQLAHRQPSSTHLRKDTHVDVVEAIVAALQCAEGEGLEVPDPVRYPEDGKLGLVFAGREYVATIEEVP